MTDKPERDEGAPIQVRAPSTDLARVPVQTTREAPAVASAARADTPLFVATPAEPLTPAQRRRAAALLGVTDASLRELLAAGAPLTLALSTSEAGARSEVQRFERAGVPAQVQGTGGLSPQLRVLAPGGALAAAALAALVGALPIAAVLALLAALAFAAVSAAGARQRGDRRALEDAGAALNEQRNAELRLPHAPALERAHALRRAVVAADLAEPLEADLLESLEGLVLGLRGLSADAPAERYGQALAELEAAVAAAGAAEAPAEALEQAAQTARATRDAAQELRRRAAQAEKQRGG
jgi:hypothetical protein